MDIRISARGLGLTDRFEEYAREKAEKVAALVPRALALEVKASRHAVAKGAAADDRVELTLVCPGPLVRAEAAAADKYAAFDLALGKLVERIRAGKDRRRVHHGKRRPVSIAEATADGFSGVGVTPASAATLRAVATGEIPVVADDEAPVDWSPVVIRRKEFPAETLTAAEAVDRMELVGHDFFLFVDAETDRPSVVYRRTGWAYGVIALTTEVAALQPRLRAGR